MAPTHFVKMCGWKETLEEEMVKKRLVWNWALIGIEASSWKVQWEWGIDWGEGREGAGHIALTCSASGSTCTSLGTSASLHLYCPTWSHHSRCRKRWEQVTSGFWTKSPCGRSFLCPIEYLHGGTQQGHRLDRHRNEYLCYQMASVAHGQCKPLNEALGNRAPHFTGFTPSCLCTSGPLMHCQKLCLSCS